MNEPSRVTAPAAPIQLGDMPTNLSALNLSGTLRHDGCAAELSEIDPLKIRFRYEENKVYNPNAEEDEVPHYEMTDGLYIPVDVRLALKFQGDQRLIPKSWEKAFADKRMCLHFTATTLRSHGEADRKVYMFYSDTNWVFRATVATNAVQRMELWLEIKKGQSRKKA